MNQDRVFRILESAEALLEQIGLRVTETEILDKAQKRAPRKPLDGKKPAKKAAKPASENSSNKEDK